MSHSSSPNLLPPKPNSKSSSRFPDGRGVGGAQTAPRAWSLRRVPMRGHQHTRAQGGPPAPATRLPTRMRLALLLPSPLGLGCGRGTERPTPDPPPGCLCRPQANLTKSQNEFKIVLKELEDSLLARLSAASGNFLGDTALVENLETTKHTASEIEEKVRARLPGLHPPSPWGPDQERGGSGTAWHTACQPTIPQTGDEPTAHRRRPPAGPTQAPFV